MIPEVYPVTVPITALAFSPDGNEVAASGYHEINFWKAADGDARRAASAGLAERVYDIAYSPDGKWLATASGDPGQFGVVKLWIAEPGRRRQAGPRPAGDAPTASSPSPSAPTASSSPPPGPTARSGSGRSTRASSWP